MPAWMLRRDKFKDARDKFVQRLGGVNRLDEVQDDLRNMVPCLQVGVATFPQPNTTRWM